ncbi:MAG: AAA family ATPase [Caldilinea sp.]|nr:AAA family ATPase [Caldilinea sp.]
MAQVRVFEQAAFEFLPGMNLLVGVNGAGKSTVLDVLCKLLSRTLPKFTAARIKSIPFTADDIRVNRDALTTRLTFAACGIDLDYLVHRPRADFRVDSKRQGEVRGQTYDVPTREELTPPNLPKHLSRQPAQPLALYFSTRRSLASDAGPSKASTAPGQAAAFADALSSRELRVRELAEWWLAQAALAREKGGSPFGRNLDVLTETVVRFLDGCTNLRAVAEPSPTLLIDKSDGPLEVRQLSDGERSMIALVLDLAKRLAQANPKLDDPIRDGQAVVLIDELDLHLHPGWQRTIVQKLTSTFPNCQFIATTHSPQIIGEVRQDRIQIIAHGQVYSPTHSFGVDSSRVLEEILDVPARTHNVDALLGRISRAIGDEQVSAAKQILTELTAIVGDNDADVIRVRTLIEFMEDEE